MFLHNIQFKKIIFRYFGWFLIYLLFIISSSFFSFYSYTSLHLIQSFFVFFAFCGVKLAFVELILINSLLYFVFFCKFLQIAYNFFSVSCGEFPMYLKTVCLLQYLYIFHLWVWICIVLVCNQNGIRNVFIISKF